MSLENEYWTFKETLQNEEKKLKEYQAIEVKQDENNPFTIEERLEAKENCIRSAKSTIKETKEILDEIREEIWDFIENGGEISEVTMKELEAENEELNGDDNMSEKFVEFELISKEDKKIYLKGNININTIDDSDGGDWEYEQNDGMLNFHIPRYWKVDGVDLTDEFKAFLDGIDWNMFRQYLWDYQDYEYFYTDFYKNKLKIWGGA